jgi:hypothetical protein
MRGPSPDAGGPSTVTVTLTCGHQLTFDSEVAPNTLPGVSMRCPICTVQRSVTLVESSPTPSGHSSWHYDETAPGHRILVLDDVDDC